MKKLTFQALREANVARAARWHGNVVWSGSDWMTATLGELGEAANFVKKLNRLRDGLVGNKGEDQDANILRAKLAEELADAATYLDLVADHYGVDLGEAVRAKFNKISERNGFPERL